jgi:hypothetical protein
MPNPFLISILTLITTLATTPTESDFNWILMEWFVKKSHTDPDYCKNLKIVFSFFFCIWLILNTPNKTTTIVGSNLQANANNAVNTANTNNGQININSQNLNINERVESYFYDKRVASHFFIKINTI